MVGSCLPETAGSDWPITVSTETARPTPTTDRPQAAPGGVGAMPHALGQNQGELVSVSERDGGGLRAGSAAGSGRSRRSTLSSTCGTSPTGSRWLRRRTPIRRPPTEEPPQPTLGGSCVSYQQLAAAGDALCAAAGAAHRARSSASARWQHVSYDALTFAVPVQWVFLLGAQARLRAPLPGRGPEEYRRLWEAGLLLFITTAVLSFSVKGDVARGYVFLVVPLTLALTPRYRTVLRRWAARLRSRGLGVENVLVVGPDAEARSLFDRLRKGWRPTAYGRSAIYPHDTDGGASAPCSPPSTPARRDMVAVVADPDLSGQSLRELSWELEERARRPRRRPRPRRRRRPAALDPPGGRPVAAARAPHAAVRRAAARQGGVRPRARGAAAARREPVLLAIAARGEGDEPRAGAVPADAGRRRRPRVHDAQVPLDGRGRRQARAPPRGRRTTATACSSR